MNDINEVLVNSGQHYDFNMAGTFLDIFKIKEPDYNLKVGSGKHGEMTGKIMASFEEVVEKEAPGGCTDPPDRVDFWRRQSPAPTPIISVAHAPARSSDLAGFFYGDTA